MPRAWLERVRNLLEGKVGLLAVLADERFGLPHALSAMDRAGEAVWVHLDAGLGADDVAAGNLIAEALNRYAGVHLYDLGYPARALAAMVAAEGPPLVTLALSGPGAERELLALLERLWGRDRMLLATGGAAPAGYAALGAEALALSREEALALAAELGFEDEAEAEALWRAAEGAYETFRQALHERLGLPPLFRPYPQGPEPPPACDAAFDPGRMLALLLRQGRLLEAFPLAVRHDPEAALRMAEGASEAFLKRGDYARLAELLEELMERYPGEEVLVRGWYEARAGQG
uniref:hypothetical protein n=1 Tax=Oceanithermus sp. TaxID=2268145 RepID=UPI002580F486